eukprot:Phypoly_transcript_19352.p1 GENE.Phypoly_transcript_19352~~Phypoly_transcript_19352.p1  ORF type:complete len:199 (+),score=21.41 Phypoly_transcript_19352:110-706(+)
MLQTWKNIVFATGPSTGIINCLEKHIKNYNSLINLGSGDGVISQFIRDKYKVQVTDLDIQQQSVTKVPSQIYDGKRIPYGKEFEVGFVCYVLHHTRTHKELLEELARVCQSHIIVIEDVTDNWWYTCVSWSHMLISIYQFGNSLGSMQFRSDREWKKLFSEMNLAVVDEGPIQDGGLRGFIRHLMYPMKHKYYVLKRP